MALLGIKLDWKAVIATSLVGAGAVYVAKVGINEAIDELTKPDGKINPTSKENVFFKGFTSMYKALTGSEDNLGEDISDFVTDTKGKFKKIFSKDDNNFPPPTWDKDGDGKYTENDMFHM